MTAPTEQTLFERIDEFVDSGRAWKAKAICAEFEQRLADADIEIERLNHANDLIGAERDAFHDKSYILNQHLESAHQEARDQTNTACEALAEMDEVKKRMNGIKNILEAITPSIAQEAVILIVNAALELAAPQQEPKSHE